MLLTIIVFILILGLLVFVHEFGHFITAKRAGARVEEFGFGFPPRIFGVKKGETIYSLNLIPLGGFVKIYGEEGQHRKDPRSFSSKKIRTRAGILVAGVSFNALLTIVLLFFGYLVGFPSLITDENRSNARDLKVQIIEVAVGSPADEAGLMAGDAILSLKFGDSSIAVDNINGVQKFIDEHKGKNIAITAQREGKEFDVSLTPRLNPPQGEGEIGIAMAETGIISLPWHKSLWRATDSTVYFARFIAFTIFKLIKDLVISGGSEILAGISGPVGIAAMTGQAARLGFIYVLQLAAVLSITLAVINVLPFPALDGGRLLFLGIEKIKGKPINQKIEKMIHSIGFFALIFLMILVTVRDIERLFK